MKIYLLIAVALCAVMISCGGNGGNGAVDKTFTYGIATTATTDELTVVDDQLSSIVSFNTSPSAESAQVIGGVNVVTATLLPGDNPLGSIGAPLQLKKMALTLARSALSVNVTAVSPTAYDDSCFTETETNVTF